MSTSLAAEGNVCGDPQRKSGHCQLIRLYTEIAASDKGMNYK